MDAKMSFLWKKNLGKKNKKWNKKGQITIFIILALIIVVIILLIFMLRRPAQIEVISEENPYSYIESCAKDAVKNAIDILSVQGGDINPKGSVMHQGKNITYLCYNSNFYDSCINQRPLLTEHIKEEIDNYLIPAVSNCFDKLKFELEKKNKVELREMSLNTELKTNEVIIEIKRELSIIEEDKSQKYETFKIVFNNQIYDLAKIAMEIANQESKFCNFDILGFMITYPKYNLTKFRTGDSDTIYTIKDRKTNQEFKFAIRSCVLPAGF
jgi:hypothetical protein